MSDVSDLKTRVLVVRGHLRSIERTAGEVTAECQALMYHVPHAESVEELEQLEQLAEAFARYEELQTITGTMFLAMNRLDSVVQEALLEPSDSDEEEGEGDDEE